MADVDRQLKQMDADIRAEGVATEKKLRENETALNKECGASIAKLIVEKGFLMNNNRKLVMKKNRMAIKRQNLKAKLERVEHVLEKAQESLRDFEEEKYQRRLRKKHGWRKLRFWK